MGWSVKKIESFIVMFAKNDKGEVVNPPRAQVMVYFRREHTTLHRAFLVEGKNKKKVIGKVLDCLLKIENEKAG